VLSLKSLIEAPDDDKEMEEAMPVYKSVVVVLLQKTDRSCRCDEDNFYQLHENIIKNNQKYSMLDRGNGVTVSLRLLSGNLMRVRRYCGSFHVIAQMPMLTSHVHACTLQLYMTIMW